MIAGNDKELKLLAKAAEEFARKQLEPEREANDKYPFGPLFTAALEKAFDLDFFHVTLAEDMNGMGLGMRALCVILETIARVDSSLSAVIFTNTHAQEILREAGSGSVLKSIAEKATNLTPYLIAYPSFNNPSECAPTLKARGGDDGYRLSGVLEYLCLGNIAAQAVLPVQIEGHRGVSFFLVDLNDIGIEKSEPVLSLGIHACPAIDIHLRNVDGVLIGQANQGARYFSKTADWMRPAAAAISLGIMKGSFKEAFQYSKERFQGGRVIVNWSEVQMLLADMALKAQSGEMIVSQACAAVDNEVDGWEAYARTAAIMVQEMACEQTCSGVQILGGVGYMKDYGQEKRFRDAQHLQALLGLAPMQKINYIRHMMP